MNAGHPHHRVHRSRTWLLALVAILGMVSSMVQPASAQGIANGAFASQFFSAVQGDALVFHLGPDALLHTPEGTYSGAAGPAEFGEDLGASFSNLQFTVQAISGTADGAILASFAMTGINTGAYRGQEANCAGIAVQGVALLEVEARSIWSEPWITTNGVRNDMPLSETISVVTEEWVSYDADAIASQIAAFNAFDPNVRPGCADHDNAVAAGAYADTASTSESALSCYMDHVCTLP